MGKKLLGPQHAARSRTSLAPQPSGPSRRPGLRLSTCNQELHNQELPEAAIVQPEAPGFCTPPLWPMGGCSSPEPTWDPGQEGLLRWVRAVAIQTLSVWAWTWRSSEDDTFPLLNREGEILPTKGKVGDCLLDVTIENNLDIDGLSAREGTLACSVTSSLKNTYMRN